MNWLRLLSIGEIDLSKLQNLWQPVGVKTKVDRIYDKIEQTQNLSFEIFNSLEERQLEVIA